jgi:HK97 family phage portal protein
MLARVLAWLGLERRALSLNDPALQRLYGASTGTATGEPVSLERSVGLTAVWACTTLIAGTIASMPLLLYRRLADGTRERAVDYPLFDVLRLRPNPVQSVTTFWEAMVTALVLRGNGYATLTRDDDGRVRALWFVHPDRVSVDLTKSGRLTYTVWTGGASTKVSDTNMLHVVGPLSEDGYTGRSVISACREALGLGLALEQYGGEFFRNAATPRGVLTLKGRLSNEGREQLASSLESGHVQRGKRHRTLVLEEGLTWQPIGISHDDAQFLEMRRFTTEEICRMFGVPGHMVAAEIRGSMTYTNTELESLRLLKFTLGPWLARISAAVNHTCIPALERRHLYAEFLPDALLATDTKGRFDAYQVGLSAGFLTVDEVRRKENLPPLPAEVPTAPEL